jgi:hypothetical protein
MPPKPPRTRADAVLEPSSGLSRAQLLTSSPAQLRARALRLLEMADEFPDHGLELQLLELAAELSARADALDRKV